MSHEEGIKKALSDRFKYLEDKIIITKPRRIFFEVNQDNFPEVFQFCVKDLQFGHLCTITGLDEADKMSAIYHLSGDSGIMLNIKISVSRENPVIKTVTQYFAGADIYERELVDLLGFKVEGLPKEGGRYPLPDNWPTDEHPLRKDWKMKDKL